MRTWTLAERVGGSGNWHIKPREEPSFSGEEIVEAIELEPVLDLLHSCDSAMRLCMATTAIAKPARQEFGDSFREIETVLREHGRVV